MMSRTLSRLVFLLGWMGGWGITPVWGLDADRDQPIQVEADAAEIDDGQKTSTYSGKVEITQGSTRIWADKVTIRHKEDRKPQWITAVGKPARYQQEVENNPNLVKARALRMEYDANGELLYLNDQAELIQGQDTFRNDRIVYDRKRGLMKGGQPAKGKERVRITIDPSQHHAAAPENLPASAGKKKPPKIPPKPLPRNKPPASP